MQRTAARTGSGGSQSWPASGRSAPGLFGRAVRKLVVSLLTLLVLCAVLFGLLLVATPSGGNARQLAKSFDTAHRAAYPGPVVPPKFAAALEATEDHRFTEEPGVDPVAVGRVTFGALTGKGDQGGATLYQQLAKMLYTPDQMSLAAEAEQVALAVKLKFGYSQAEILRLYADVAYFGHGYYGLENASCGYFGVRPAQLSWPQAALLAGLVQAPTTDDPLDDPAAGIAREQHVISRLVAVGQLSQAAADAYLAIPLSRLVSQAGDCTG
jgi:membrane peptidoglycan carboxypeptidase